MLSQQVIHGDVLQYDVVGVGSVFEVLVHRYGAFQQLDTVESQKGCRHQANGGQHAESAANTIRHAEAQTCSVRLVLATDGPLPCLVLTVQDDGVGLPAELQFGVGLTSMRERAEELGGSCTIDSSQGGGTLVSAMLPFTVGGER